MAWKRWTALGAGALLLALLGGYLVYRHFTDVWLTDEIVWRDLGDAQSVLFDRRRGIRIAGPGSILLWGEYPYLAGDVSPGRGQKISHFVYHIPTGEVRYDTQEARMICVRVNVPDGQGISRYVTMDDLLETRQWHNPAKLAGLRSALKP